jgi:hypothetical protein
VQLKNRMSKYIDDVVVKLKRVYSKDELVVTMINEQALLKKEINLLKTQNDRLKYKLKKILKLDKKEIIAVKAEMKEKFIYKNMQKEIDSLRKQCELLKNANYKLTYKQWKYEQETNTKATTTIRQTTKG